WHYQDCRCNEIQYLTQSAFLHNCSPFPIFFERSKVSRHQRLRLYLSFLPKGFSYLIPVILMPSTRYRCMRKNSINVGIAPNRAAANTMLHSVSYPPPTILASATCTTISSSFWLIINGHK